MFVVTLKSSELGMKRKKTQAGVGRKAREADFHNSNESIFDAVQAFIVLENERNRRRDGASIVKVPRRFSHIIFLRAI